MRNTSLAPGCSRETAGLEGCASIGQLKCCTEVDDDSERLRWSLLIITGETQTLFSEPMLGKGKVKEKVRDFVTICGQMRRHQ